MDENDEYGKTYKQIDLHKSKNVMPGYGNSKTKYKEYLARENKQKFKS